MSEPGGYAARAHPTLEDPVAAALSEAVGGPLGEHSAAHRWWTPVRVVLALTAVCFALELTCLDVWHLPNFSFCEAESDFNDVISTILSSACSGPFLGAVFAPHSRSRH